MREPQRVTAAIIGGGPAGASAALELARVGIPALIFEQTDGSGNAIGECLAPTANPLLESLGLAGIMQASTAIPSHGNRSSWGENGSPTDHDFLRNPFGHGWHLDRPAFNRALLDGVERAGGAVVRGHRVTSLRRVNDCWQIMTTSSDGKRQFHADMLIDASGRRALVARRDQTRRRVIDSLVAAVAFLEAEEGTDSLCDGTTSIEATEHGWWYAALLPNRRLAVTWFTDPDLLARSGAWRPDAWWTQVRQTDLMTSLIAPHGYGLPGQIHARAAGSSLLVPPSGDGWIAAGDAAAAHDPLSSHGIGSALAAGKRAARAIIAHIEGDRSAIPTYGERHLADYTRYLWMRSAYYADEQRWANAPFWRRRHGTLFALANHASERIEEVAIRPEVSGN